MKLHKFLNEWHWQGPYIPGRRGVAVGRGDYWQRIVILPIDGQRTSIVAETDKAVLIHQELQAPDGSPRVIEAWIPLSKAKLKKDKTRIRIPRWLFSKSGLKELKNEVIPISNKEPLV